MLRPLGRLVSPSPRAAAASPLWVRSATSRMNTIATSATTATTAEIRKIRPVASP